MTEMTEYTFVKYIKGDIALVIFQIGQNLVLFGVVVIHKWDLLICTHLKL